MAEPGAVGRGVDQLILRLGRADAVIIEALAKVGRPERFAGTGCGETGIEKAFAAPVPGGLREFDPLDGIVERAAAIDVDQAQRAPIAARILHAIGEHPAIGRGRPLRERAGAILRPAVGIEQNPLPARQPFAHIKRGLIFQPPVIAIEIAVARLAGDSVAAMGEERLQARLERLAPRQRVEIAASERIFPRHPVADRRIGAQVIFQPAIGIGDRHAEMILHYVLPAGERIAQRRIARRDRRVVGMCAQHGRGSGQPERQQDQGEAAHPLFQALLYITKTGRASHKENAACR